MNKINYQQQLDAIIEEHGRRGEKPSLLLHSCCAPCSSYTLEYLSQYFRITVFYYNPNIMRREEYEKRVAEQRRLIEELNLEYSENSEISEKSENSEVSELSERFPISFVEGRYSPRDFTSAVKGLEQEPEGGKRCHVCYSLRLEEAAIEAAKGGYDYFCTTLSISPLKHADWLNDIGEAMANKYKVRWLPSDFKKKGGYQRSIVLSKEHNLYRQNFCGCEYSKTARRLGAKRLDG